MTGTHRDQWRASPTVQIVRQRYNISALRQRFHGQEIEYVFVRSNGQGTEDPADAQQDQENDEEPIQAN